MPKVSIIVPVYKVEEYINRCVDSLIGQTLQDIEIILVDDGSPDRCGEICDGYSELDPRIKVIHQKNKGLPGARNSGIRIATGEYIGFVDSDDFAEPDMFEKLYSCAVTHNTDFVMCDYVRDSGDSKSTYSTDIRSGLYHKSDLISEIYPILVMTESVDYGPILSVWRCLYRRDFIVENGLLFDEEVRLSEDCIFSIYICLKANTFYYLKENYLYHYWYNPNSLSQSYKAFAWDSFCLMNSKLKSSLAMESFDFSRQLDLHMLYFTMNMLQRVAINSQFNTKKKRKMVSDILNTPCVRQAMKNFRIPKVSIKFRMLIFMVKHRLTLPLSIILCH